MFYLKICQKLQNGFLVSVTWCTERRLRILSPSQLCAPNAGAAQLIGNIPYRSIPRRTSTQARTDLTDLDDLIAAGLILDSGAATTVRARRAYLLGRQRYTYGYTEYLWARVAQNPTARSLLEQFLFVIHCASV